MSNRLRRLNVVTNCRSFRTFVHLKSYIFGNLVPEHDKTTVDESVTLGKNKPFVILKDIRTGRAESSHDSKQVAALKIQNSKRQNVSSDFASVNQSSIQQLPATLRSVLTDSGKKENGKIIQRGINWNTIQLLGNYDKNMWKTKRDVGLRK